MLFDKFVQLQVHPDARSEPGEAKQVRLNPAEAAAYLNGYTFATYLVALKPTSFKLRRVSAGLVEQIEPGSGTAVWARNWETVCAELTAVGV